MTGKLIGRIRRDLAWHYVGSDGKTADCMGVVRSAHQTTELVDVHPRGSESLCGCCAWEDK